MSETLAERLKNSAQRFIESGGDPATATIRRIVRDENDRRMSGVMARIVHFDDDGVEIDECKAELSNSDYVSYNDLAHLGLKIHMHLRSD